MLAPLPRELAPPPRGNPGSATVVVSCFLYLLSCASGNVGGVRLVVHTAGTAPNVVESGFDVQLGTSVSVAMTGKKFKRLGQPHSK